MVVKGATGIKTGIAIHWWMAIQVFILAYPSIALVAPSPVFIELSHYSDAIMGATASQITSLTIVYSGAGQRKHQSSSSLGFVWGIHRWPVNSPHKWPVTRKMFPSDDVIMRIWCNTSRFVLGASNSSCGPAFRLDWVKYWGLSLQRGPW